MTINNDRTQKLPKPSANQQSDFNGVGEDTPRRVSLPPKQSLANSATQQQRWIPPTRPTQARQPQEVAATAVWAVPTAPLQVGQQRRTVTPALAPQGVSARPVPTYPTDQPLVAPPLGMPTPASPPYPKERPPVAPPPFIAAPLPQPKRRRLTLPVMIILVFLAILIGLGGYLGRQWGISSTIPGQAPSTQATTHAGPFVQLPLSAMQINALRHLAGYMKYKQLASMYVSRMSLDVELGQLIMVEYADTSYSSDLDTMVNQLHAGGVIMYEFQMQTFGQTKHDIAQMQQRATFPLLVSTDEEGGPYVHRLKNIYGLRMSATDIYNTGDPNVATQQGLKAAHDLSALGINENLAPDVDVNLINGYDMVTRTFGYDPGSVVKFAGAYLRALQGAGVVGCIKHFPGLGDAVSDAHAGLPVVNRTRDQIYATELAPFQHFIQSQSAFDSPGMIMPTNVLMPAIDPVWPAELSHTFMTDILRKQFGYDGVVLTDALYMKGIADKWSMPEAAILALNAGNDMLLGPTGAGQMIEMLNALKQALKDGTLSKARVDEAATRIIALKMAYHLMPAIPPQA